MGGLPQAARKSRRSIGGLLCVFRLGVVVFCSGKHIIIIIIIRFHRRRERKEWSRETHQREEFELASGRKDGVGRTRDKPRRTTNNNNNNNNNAKKKGGGHAQESLETNTIPVKKA